MKQGKHSIKKKERDGMAKGGPKRAMYGHGGKNKMKAMYNEGGMYKDGEMPQAKPC